MDEDAFNNGDVDVSSAGDVSEGGVVDKMVVVTIVVGGGVEVVVVVIVDLRDGGSGKPVKGRRVDMVIVGQVIGGYILGR